MNREYAALSLRKQNASLHLIKHVCRACNRPLGKNRNDLTNKIGKILIKLEHILKKSETVLKKLENHLEKLKTILINLTLYRCFLFKKLGGGGYFCFVFCLIPSVAQLSSVSYYFLCFLDAAYLHLDA